jgi:predicted nucleotidyltransferase
LRTDFRAVGDHHVCRGADTFLHADWIGCHNSDMTAVPRNSPRQELLHRERSRILSFVESRGGRAVRVFGSVARGEDDSQSDIDLLIELPAGESAGSELLTVLGLSEELSELVGIRVDVVTPRTLRDDVRTAAIAEAIPL